MPLRGLNCGQHILGPGLLQFPLHCRWTADPGPEVMRANTDTETAKLPRTISGAKDAVVVPPTGCSVMDGSLFRDRKPPSAGSDALFGCTNEVQVAGERFCLGHGGAVLNAAGTATMGPLDRRYTPICTQEADAALQSIGRGGQQGRYRPFFVPNWFLSAPQGRFPLPAAFVRADLRRRANRSKLCLQRGVYCG